MNMSKGILFLIGIFIVFNGNSQDSDIIYLSKKRVPTKESKAAFIQEITKINDTLYSIIEYDKDKNILMSGEYSSINPNVENGQFKFLDYCGGSIKVYGYYTNSEMSGKWTYQYDDYNKKVIIYDSLTNLTKIPREQYMDSIGAHVIGEKMPKFQGGGPGDFNTYIKQNINYPPIPLRLGITGTAIVDFIVDVNGKVCFVGLAKSSLNKDLDREALRLVSQSPDWTSGQRDGKVIPFSFSFPVIFNLE